MVILCFSVEWSLTKIWGKAPKMPTISPEKRRGTKLSSLPVCAATIAEMNIIAASRSSEIPIIRMTNFFLIEPTNIRINLRFLLPLSPLC